MKFIKTLFIIATASLFATSVYAADLSIDMLNKDADGNKMVYSPQVAKVAVGDTVTWLPASKGHNVEFIAGPEGFDIPKKSRNNKEYSFKFDIPGIYLYQCTPHKGIGMVALVVVGDDISNKDAISKAKVVGKSKKTLKKLLGEL